MIGFLRGKARRGIGRLCLLRTWARVRRRTTWCWIRHLGHDPMTEVDQLRFRTDWKGRPTGQAPQIRGRHLECRRCGRRLKPIS